MDSDAQFISTAQLAIRWGVSQATLRSWRQRNVGPPYMKPGTAKSTRIRYRISDIEQYEKEHMRSGTND